MNVSKPSLPKANRNSANPYTLIRVHGPDGRTFHFPSRTPKHKILSFMQKTYSPKSVVGSANRRRAKLGRMPRTSLPSLPTLPTIPKPPEGIK